MTKPTNKQKLTQQILDNFNVGEIYYIYIQAYKKAYGHHPDEE